MDVFRSVRFCFVKTDTLKNKSNQFVQWQGIKLLNYSFFLLTKYVNLIKLCT